MKTSTKLLIGLLALIILINLYIVIVVRVHVEGFSKGTDLPEFKNFKPEIRIDKNIDFFNEIEVLCPVRVYYKRGNESNIEFSTNKNLAKYLRYEVFDQRLLIDHDKIEPGEILEINLITDSLTNIYLGDGARFESDNIDVDSCSIIVSDAFFNAKVNTKTLYINAIGKSMITIEGETDYIKSHVSNNCVFNSTGLIINKKKIDESNMQEM